MTLPAPFFCKETPIRKQALFLGRGDGSGSGEFQILTAAKRKMAAVML